MLVKYSDLLEFPKCIEQLLERGIEPEELELDTVKDRIEKDLQEDRETMEELYGAFWDRSLGAPR